MALVGAGAVVVVAVVVLRSNGGDSGASAPSASATATAEVARKDLVLSDSYEGDVGYGDATGISANKTGVVTSVTAAGTVVDTGATLFTIDLQPTVLLRGSVPTFRALDVDSEAGADVAQLEQALVDLGFGKNLTVDETFTAATANAVEAWEESLGRFDPDGVVELGDVVFSAGAVRVAEVSSRVGTQVRSDSVVVTASSTSKVVTMSVNADTATRLEPGTAVQLELPGNVETTGKITEVGPPTASTQQGPGGAGATVTVTIALDDPAVADAFDSGSVEVTIERSRVENAVTVPVTSLLALSEGGYAVQVVDAASENGYRLVAVEVGTYSGNDVQVSGNGIEPGVEIVVPR